MFLRKLAVERLRILTRVEVEPASRVNVFTGPNGSGKTSLLEAVHLLGTGRSFRASTAREMVQRGQSRFLCRGEVVGPGEEVHIIGIEQGEGPGRVRRSGTDVRNASSLARSLPLVFVSPDSQRLLSDGSELRRGVIDWALFHVEPIYGSLHSRYRRVLRQRNAGLRQGLGGRALDPWTDELAVVGEEIHRLRSQFLEVALPLFESFVERLLGKPVAITYERGWDEGRSLKERLTFALPQDQSRGFTTVGAHRADLHFLVANVRANRVLSRGESKLFVIALLLSQVEFFASNTGETCVVLLDELASELDETSRTRVFDCLEALHVQAFLTAVSPELVTGSTTRRPCLFHVEHGTVSKVV